MKRPRKPARSRARRKAHRSPKVLLSSEEQRQARAAQRSRMANLALESAGVLIMGLPALLVIGAVTKAVFDHTRESQQDTLADQAEADGLRAEADALALQFTRNWVPVSIFRSTSDRQPLLNVYWVWRDQARCESLVGFTHTSDQLSPLQTVGKLREEAPEATNCPNIVRALSFKEILAQSADVRYADTPGLQALSVRAASYQLWLRQQAANTAAGLPRESGTGMFE